MTLIMKSLIVSSSYVSLISALAFDAPLATPVWTNFALEPQGWSPKPTQAPSLDELRRRQEIQNLLLASDGTCGFVSGSSASPFGLCCSTCTCGFQTFPNEYGNYYCCNPTTCESRSYTTCIDNNRFSVSSVCDAQCISDPHTLICTNTPYTYCNLAEFEGVTVQALFCDSVTISHTQSILTTFVGEVDRSLTTFMGYAGSTSSPSSSSSSSPSSSSSSSSSSSLTSSSSSVTSSTSPSQGNTSPSQTSPVPTPSPTSSSSGPPIGAIVGGSVGGVALIAIVGFLIYFLLRRQKKSQNAAISAAQIAPETSSQYIPSQRPLASYPAASGYYDKPTWSAPQQAYNERESQYGRPQDPRFSQQSQPYGQGYQQSPPQPPFDPSQQVAQQYNPRTPTVPELQANAASSTTTAYGRSPGGSGSGYGGRYEVQG